MDNMGALPVRMDFQAASTSRIFSPALLRFWVKRPPLFPRPAGQRHALSHGSLQPERYLYAASAYSGNPRSSSCFRADDERHRSIGKTVIVRKPPRPSLLENRMLAWQPGKLI